MQGQVVVITGASRGIGAAAARAFAQAGAKLALLSRSGCAAPVGADAMVLACDVADAAAVSGAIDAVMARWGRVDVLINNAGMIEPIARLAKAEPDLWSRAIDVNLKGVFYAMRAVIPIIRAQGAGTILNLSSGAAHNPQDGWSSYCAAKAGAAMLTRAAHLEEAAHGLRIIGLSPGTVATEMQVVIKASGVNPVSQLDWGVHIPADWPAKALVWMCSSAADGWLGQDISLRDEAVRRAVGLVA